MADFKRIYREYLNTVKGDIEVQMRSQNRVASGDAIKSLRVVANQFLEAEIRGLRYIGTLEDGVGSQPSSFGSAFINDIMSWMKAKGISPLRKGKVLPSTDTNIRRAAGGIARNIVRHGTKIKQGEHGLDLKEAIDENKPQLLKDMGKEMILDFTEQFKIKGK